MALAVKSPSYDPKGTVTKKTIANSSGPGQSVPGGGGGGGGGGTGDFSGPGSSTAGDFVQFADGTGKRGSDGGLRSSSFDPAGAAAAAQSNAETYADAQAAAALAMAKAYTDLKLPWFNIVTYGAVGDGSTDDTNAINLAIAALNAKGKGVLYAPSAVFYKTVGNVSVITARATVMGDGRMSQIQFNGGPGIEFSQSAADYCYIHDISLYQNTGGGSTYGVFYNGGSGSGALTDTFTCDRVECGGGWQIGINVQVVSAGKIKITDTHCYAPSGGWPGTVMGTAFFLLCGGCTATLRDCKSENTTTCVYLNGVSGNSMEGTIITGYLGPNTFNGIVADTFTANTQSLNNFFNPRTQAVSMAGDQNSAIGDYYLWNTTGASGILMTGSYCLAMNNRMFGGSVGTNGIQFGTGAGAALYNKASGNFVGNLSGTGIRLASQCNTCSARDNTFATVSTNTSDAGTNDSITNSLS